MCKVKVLKKNSLKGGWSRWNFKLTRRINDEMYLELRWKRDAICLRNGGEELKGQRFHKRNDKRTVIETYLFRFRR